MHRVHAHLGLPAAKGRTCLGLGPRGFGNSAVGDGTDTFERIHSEFREGEQLGGVRRYRNPRPRHRCVLLTIDGFRVA